MASRHWGPVEAKSNRGCCLGRRHCCHSNTVKPLPLTYHILRFPISSLQAWCQTTLHFLSSTIGSELTSLRSNDVKFGPIIAKNVAVATSSHPMRDEEDDNVPHWILSAMRCLAHWPEKAKNNAFPSYKGINPNPHGEGGSIRPPPPPSIYC